MKTLCVFGTRPEAIKMAPVVLALASDERFDAKVCVTGQHREMLDQVLNLFAIQPEFDLNIMKPGQELTDVTAAILQGMRDVFAQFRPDVVLVHGDTATTLAASLAAYHHRIAVAHVEAGLRTGNLYSPWPEEANRKLTGALATLHFAPTDTSRENLLREGVPAGRIVVTGNTVVDALLDVVKRLDTDRELARTAAEPTAFLDHGPSPRELRRRLRAYLPGTEGSCTAAPFDRHRISGSPQPQCTGACESAAVRCQ
jgi:UDP-N-acetylglucosamine 2-epimerase (non-hydrolysing)